MTVTTVTFHIKSCKSLYKSKKLLVMSFMCVWYNQMFLFDCVTLLVEFYRLILWEYFTHALSLHFLHQLQDHHPVHWQSVWTIPPWWKWAEQKAHSGQQGALLLLFHFAIWTRVKKTKTKNKGTFMQLNLSVTTCISLSIDVFRFRFITQYH